MIALLPQILIVFLFALVATLLCHRLRVPPIIGLLLSGIAVGPSGFRLVESSETIEVLARIGVNLLLFTIGAEFSLRGLLEIKTEVMIGGAVQVTLACLTTYVISRAELGAAPALLVGFVVTLSSTALVLKLLKERGEISTPAGRTTFAVLLFQDLLAVPLLLIVPYLGTSAAGQSQAPLVWVWPFIKGVLVIFSVLLAASWIIPRLLHRAAATKDREVFLLTLIVICSGVAFLSLLAGLSLALGSLLAGLIVSESEYSHPAISNILPFQQAFVTLFFVSIGMLIDLPFSLNHLPFILGVTTAVIVGKTLLALPVALVLGLPLRTGIISSMSLAQVGEFSFILAQSGFHHGVISWACYQSILSVSVLTIAATPILISLAPKTADVLSQMSVGKLLSVGWRTGPAPEAAALPAPRGHILIVGYGVNGREAALAAQQSGMPYRVLEISVAAVRAARDRSVPIFYGDATHEEVLNRHGIRAAAVAVVALADPLVSRRIVSKMRELNPTCFILVRTRLGEEIAALQSLGASKVVSEELEATGAIVRELLAQTAALRNFLS